MDKAQEIINFIEEEMLDDDIEIKNDMSLFRGRVLDSLKMARLISFLERTYGIKVKMMDIIYENFDTINNMVDYVDRKKES